MKKMNWLWVFLSGGLLGAALSSWLAPLGIAWYFDPPVDIGVNCKSATEWAMSRLVWTQIVGTFAGGVVFLLLVMAWTKKRQSYTQD